MTVTEWDALAKKYKYPASSRLIYVFGSWNGVKVALGLEGNKRRYSELD